MPETSQNVAAEYKISREDQDKMALDKLKGAVHQDDAVTAGNASGVNDGACALLSANEAAAKQHGLTSCARVVGLATVDVPPRTMGVGPAPAWSPQRLTSCTRTVAAMRCAPCALVRVRVLRW